MEERLAGPWSAPPARGSPRRTARPAVVPGRSAAALLVRRRPPPSRPPKGKRGIRGSCSSSLAAGRRPRSAARCARRRARRPAELVAAALELAAEANAQDPALKIFHLILIFS